MTTIKGARFGSLIVLLLACLPLVSQLTVMGQTGSLAVPARANIYGAGHASPPSPAGGGGGILPPSFALVGGETVTFQAKGVVAPTIGGDSYGPDGLRGAATQLEPYGGISGIRGNSRLFLAGVFLDDQVPTGASPSMLDFVNGDFAELSPSLRQIFFIGDGLTGTASGTAQKFTAPVGATRLFLGFADGFDFTGLPGLYADNLGGVSVTYTRTKLGPVILSQPQSIEVKSGGAATFVVQASGKGVSQYQWRFNGARMAGSTTSNLVLSNVTALDEGDYTAQITDDTGTVVSNSARLVLFRDSDGDGLSDYFEKGGGRFELVLGSLTWEEAKADAEWRGGHLATIIHQAEWDALLSVMGNFYTGLSIWLGGTDAITEGSWKWVTGEAWGYTRWTSGEPDNLGNQDYALLIGNGLWNDYGTSQRAYYLFEKGFYSNPNNPDTDGDGFNDGIESEAGSIPTDPNSRPLPRITQQPQAMNVIGGGSFTLAVSANGYGPLAFQWRFNGAPIIGATNGTLFVANAQPSSAGRYDVVLRNAAGTLTSAEAVVRITPFLEVQRQSNGFVIVQLLDSRALGWIVEASDDLKAWQRLGAITFAGGLGVFLDATALGKPQRFYRVVAP